MSHGHRILLKWARTLHVYLTLFGFVLLLFFAVTGFLLNHEEWFVSDVPHEHTTTSSVPMRYLEPLDELALVELLRKEQGVTGALDIPQEGGKKTQDRPGFQRKGETLTGVFRGPGRQCTVTLQRADGSTTVTHRSWGTVRVLTDLHRGYSTGAVWSLVFDAVSIAFVIVSVTGLMLWSSLRARGKHGLLVLCLGLAVGLVAYFVFVP